MARLHDEVYTQTNDDEDENPTDWHLPNISSLIKTLNSIREGVYGHERRIRVGFGVLEALEHAGVVSLDSEGGDKKNKVGKMERVERMWIEMLKGTLGRTLGRGNGNGRGIRGAIRYV
jgi:hypothetical protein